jgi:hypothetical protein
MLLLWQSAATERHSVEFAEEVGCDTKRCALVPWCSRERQTQTAVRKTLKGISKLRRSVATQKRETKQSYLVAQI